MSGVDVGTTRHQRYGGCLSLENGATDFSVLQARLPSPQPLRLILEAQCSIGVVQLEAAI